MTELEDWRNGGFGLYIHWPFCQSKCPYCDFNSHVAAEIDQARWARAYLSEIDRLRAETAGRTLNTVFFGGGTPSLMEPELVHALMERIRASWPVANDFEVTLEANPSTVEAGRFRGFRDAGVTRVSMGIQALNDADLRRLGRMHSVAEARSAFDIARGAFDRVSFDLIYARQGQGVEDWKEELQQALSISIDHVSLYQLTIEDGTVFAARQSAGLLKGLPDDDTAAEMYFATQEICEAAGMPAYEVSNHARDMAQSRHNLIYWRSGDYGGIGPGAHGRLTLAGQRWATDTPLAPQVWLDRVESRSNGEKSRTPLPPEDQASEFLMMGLRLSEGISLHRYEGLAGQALPDAKLTPLEELGLVERTGDRLRTTAAGRPVLNAVLRELIAD